MQSESLTSNDGVLAALSKCVEWDRFFRLADFVGSSLDAPKDRFDKASILELGVDTYSHRRVRWVDERHHDHEVQHINVRYRVEMKFGSHLLSTPKKGRIRRTIAVRLSNVLGKHSHERERRFKSDFADLLLLADHQRIAILPRILVMQHLTFAADCVTLRVPGSVIEEHVLVTRSPTVPSTVRKPCDFREQKIKLIRRLVDSIH
jgi:hypothetical protein